MPPLKAAALLVLLSLAAASALAACPRRSDMSLGDKLLRSPLAVQARATGRSRAGENGLYFASFRVHRVLRGQLPRHLRRHLRLAFSQRPSSCAQPPEFNVKGGVRYVLLARMGRLSRRLEATFSPELWTRPSRRVVKRTLCAGCGELSPPRVCTTCVRTM